MLVVPAVSHPPPKLNHVVNHQGLTDCLDSRVVSGRFSSRQPFSLCKFYCFSIDMHPKNLPHCNQFKVYSYINICILFPSTYFCWKNDFTCLKVSYGQVFSNLFKMKVMVRVPYSCRAGDVHSEPKFPIQMPGVTDKLMRIPSLKVFANNLWPFGGNLARPADVDAPALLLFCSPGTPSGINNNRAQI